MTRIAKRSSDLDRPLCWQGFRVHLPNEWALAAFSGDWDSGYLRAEGPDGDAVELKWKRDTASPSLKGVMKSYVKALNKAAGRGSGEVALKEKPRALPSVPHGAGVSQTFAWEGRVHGIGAIWHCLDRQCRRIVIAQVTSADAGAAGALARRILPNIEDHPEGDIVPWSVYDFSFEAPREFRLEKQSLRSGHLTLEFASRGRRLILDRFGPATVLLKRDSLEEWATGVKPLFDRLKPFAYRKSVSNNGGHTVVRITGRRRSVKDLAIRAALWLIRRAAPDAVEGRVWNCPESNRIYGVWAEGTPTDAQARAESACATVACHTEVEA